VCKRLGEFAPHGRLQRVLFEHSSYFADQLLRYPEMLDEISEPFQLEGGELSDAVTLRRFYRRQMLRIRARAFCEARPSSRR